MAIVACNGRVAPVGGGDVERASSDAPAGVPGPSAAPALTPPGDGCGEMVTKLFASRSLFMGAPSRFAVDDTCGIPATVGDGPIRGASRLSARGGPPRSLLTVPFTVSLLRPAAGKLFVAVGAAATQPGHLQEPAAIETIDAAGVVVPMPLGFADVNIFRETRRRRRGGRRERVLQHQPQRERGALPGRACRAPPCSSQARTPPSGCSRSATTPCSRRTTLRPGSFTPCRRAAPLRRRSGGPSASASRRQRSACSSWSPVPTAIPRRVRPARPEDRLGDSDGWFAPLEILSDGLFVYWRNAPYYDASGALVLGNAYRAKVDGSCDRTFPPDGGLWRRPAARGLARRVPTRRKASSRRADARRRGEPREREGSKSFASALALEHEARACYARTMKKLPPCSSSRCSPGARRVRRRRRRVARAMRRPRRSVRRR